MPPWETRSHFKNIELKIEKMSLGSYPGKKLLSKTDFYQNEQNFDGTFSTK